MKQGGPASSVRKGLAGYMQTAAISSVPLSMRGQDGYDGECG